MLNLPLNLKENAKLQKLQKQLNERKARILDPKCYNIGIDIQGVNKQIKEKQLCKLQEEENEKLFAKLVIQNDKLSQKAQEISKMKKLKMNKEIDEFRKVYQRRNQTREWDINDKKTVYATYIEEAKLGPSAAQRFEGEDNVYKNRKKTEMQKQKTWLQQQIKEKKKIQEHERHLEDQYALNVKKLDAQIQKLEAAEKQCRRYMQQATNDLNKKLVAERKQQQQDYLNKQNDELQEIQNSIYSDLLNESTVKNALGNVQPEHFRGLTMRELANIRQQQLQQIEEQRLKKEKEKHEEEKWNLLMKYNEQTALQTVESIEKKKKEISSKIQKENMMLAAQQKLRHEDKEYLYFTDENDFYRHFGTSAR